MPSNVFIVDDHPIFREGLQQVIERSPSFKVVGQLGDGALAMNEMRRVAPDIAVLDVQLPKVSGIELAKSLRTLNPPIAVIFLTVQSDEGTFNAALDAGAKGYILKENASEDILLALQAVRSGGLYFSAAIAQFLVRRNERASALREKKTGLASLTPTERNILRLVAENRTNREIGDLLFISHRTVEAHRAHICEKLELKGNRALFLFAVQHKSEI
jgi:DNA-binding NarL/FixJ family response regulator